MCCVWFGVVYCPPHRADLSIYESAVGVKGHFFRVGATAPTLVRLAAAKAVESVESVLCFPSNCGHPRFLRMSIVAALSTAFFGRQGHHSQ